MATAAQSPNDLTRQQLDELDALLQRMLSLPLNPPESFPSNANGSVQNFALPMPTPAPYQSPPPAAREVAMPVVATAPRVFTPPAPEPAEMPALWKSAPAPVVAPAPAPRPSPAPAPVFAPAPMPAPAFEWPDSTSVRTLPPAPPAAPAAAQPEPVPFLYAPFVGLNAVLNWILGLFGFPGRVVRSGFVKSLFGLAGLGLLVYTGLKVAQIHGLVTLPQQLPWPR